MRLTRDHLIAPDWETPPSPRRVIVGSLSYAGIVVPGAVALVMATFLVGVVAVSIEVLVSTTGVLAGF